MEDDTADVVAGHAEDDVGVADVLALEAAALVLGEVDASGREHLDGVVGGGPAPSEGAGRVHARVHAP